MLQQSVAPVRDTTTAPAVADWLPEWLGTMPLADPVVLVRVLLLLFIGLPVALWISRTTRSWVARTSNPQRGLVVGKLIWYAGLLAIFVTVLSELGFSLAPLLGAAGILGIALGFASQTSVSNIISGFFLMGEEPFVVGDIIELGTTRGRVLSIDMMSVKLQTFDNRFVRIPNETLIKSEVVNMTRFPLRRVDVMVGVAYKEDLSQVRSVLLQVARINPLCLMEPEPKIIFQGYGESSLNYLFAVWTTRENWVELKTSIHEEIKAAFDDADIEIPFPHRTLYAGAVTDPFPIRIISGDGPSLPDTPGDGGPAEPGGDASDEAPTAGEGAPPARGPQA